MHPRTVGPYTLLAVLGVGRLGPVHVGRTPDGVRVVVRVIRAEFAADRFFRCCLRDEVEIASRVRGPGVVAVLDADVDAEAPWVATEYVPALSLAEIVDRCGPLSVDGVRQLGVDLTGALETIHDAGAVHHDLTPRSVLVTADGPRIINTGLTRAAAASPLTRGGGLLGTPGYLAPEQLLNGPGEPASDVFALGSVLLHAATWREPFGSGDVTAILHRVRRVGPDLRGLDPGIAPVVAACLHPDPARRPSPREVRDALTELETPSSEAAPADVGDPPEEPHSSDRASANGIPAPRTPADDRAADEAAPRVAVPTGDS